MSSNPNILSSDEEEAEEKIDFTGYVLKSTYVVIKMLGIGASSSVWLAYNLKKSTFIVIKIQFEDDTHHAKDEILIFKKINKLKSKYISYLLDHFVYKKRICMVFPVLGENLLDYKSKYYISKADIKSIILQILKGLDVLHTKGIIHTDIKPENILFNDPTPETKQIIKMFSKNLNNDILNWKKYIINILQQISVSSDIEDSDFNFKITDFGTSCLTTNKTKEFTLGTRYYLSPEIILGHDYNTQIDIYAVGCILYELLAEDILFDPNKTTNFSTDQVHLNMMQNILGQIPKRFKKCKKYRKYKKLCKKTFITKKQLKLSNLIKKNIDDDEQLIDLCTRLLDLDPNTRINAHDALKHPWLCKVIHKIYIFGDTTNNSFGLSISNQAHHYKIKDTKTKEQLELLGFFKAIELLLVNITNMDQFIIYTDNKYFTKCKNIWQNNTSTKPKTTSKTELLHKLYGVLDIYNITFTQLTKSLHKTNIGYSLYLLEQLSNKID